VFAATHVSWFKTVQEFAEKGIKIRRVDSAATAGVRYEGSTGFGHGCPFGMGLVVLDDATYDYDLEVARSLGKEAVEWVEHRHDRFQEAMKGREVKPYSFMNGAIFPNMALMGFYSPLAGRHFILFQPRGPAEFEQWQWTMVEKEAPNVVKEVAAEYVYRGQHMGGAIAPDDVENMERIVEAMRAPRNWRRPHHYGMQLGHESEGPQGLPGNLGPNPSEVNQRNFYRFWLELMEKD
jgi:hypothetical protein